MWMSIGKIRLLLKTLLAFWARSLFIHLSRGEATGPLARPRHPMRVGRTVGGAALGGMTKTMIKSLKRQFLIRRTALLVMAAAFGLASLFVFGGQQVAQAQESRHLPGESFDLEKVHNDDPWGIWSDGTTFWINDRSDRQFYAYNVGNKARNSDKDKYIKHYTSSGFHVHNDYMHLAVDPNHYPARDAKGYGYADFSKMPNNQSVDNSSSFDLNLGHIGVNKHPHPAGVWSDSTHIYISDYAEPESHDHNGAAVYAYHASTGELDAPRSLSGIDDPVSRIGGIWCDGKTMWVVDVPNRKVYAYNFSTKARDSSKDFTLHSDNSDPRGIWSDGLVLYVVDTGDNEVYAYDIADLTFPYGTLHPDTGEPQDVWADTIYDRVKWVSSLNAGKLHAYSIDTNQRLPSRDIDTAASGNAAPSGIMNNWVTWYVADLRDGKVYAYNANTLERQPDKDINNLASSTGNPTPTDIFVNSSTIWVADRHDKKAYAYVLSTGARDSGKDIALPHAGRTRGIYMHGGIMWASGSEEERLYAYAVSTGHRQPGWDIKLISENAQPKGLWFDGTEMWVLNNGEPYKVFEYGLPNVDPVQLDRQNERSSGLTGDDGVVWVSDWARDRIYAYDSNWSRLPDRDVDGLATAGNDSSHGIWSDGLYILVADWHDAVIRVYLAGQSSNPRVPSFDIDLDPENSAPTGLWSDWDTLWVADTDDKKAYAYALSGGERRPNEDVAFSQSSGVFGIWSNGTVFWTGGNDVGTLQAYSRNGTRRSHLDIVLAPENDYTRGIWSDGHDMYVLQGNKPHLYSYPMPPSITVSANPVFLHENGGATPLIATVKGGLGIPDGASLSVDIVHGTTDGQDISVTANSGPVEMSDGSGSVRLTLTPDNNNDYEGRKHFYLRATVSHSSLSEDLRSRTALVLLEDDPQESQQVGGL